MIFLYIILLILEIGLLSYIIYNFIKYRNFSIKTTIAYPCLIIYSIIVIFFINLLMNSKTNWYYNLAYSFSPAIKLLAFEVNEEMITFLTNKGEIILLLDYLVLIISSIIITFGLTILLAKSVINNMRRKVIFSKEINYIIGLDDEAKIYLTNEIKTKEHKNCCILQYDPNKSLKDEKIFLDEKKTKYKVEKYNSKKEYFKLLNKLLFFKNKKYHVIFFKRSDKELLELFEWTKDYILEVILTKHKDILDNIEFIFSLDELQKPFIEEYVMNKLYIKDEADPKKQKNITEGLIRFFNKYDLISYKFIFENNLAKYMPKQYLNNDCTVDEDIVVNFFSIGLGKINSALIRDNLINTQFIRKKKSNDKYILEAIRPEVYIYDNHNEISHNELSFGILKYQKEKYKGLYNNLPDDYYSHIHMNLNTDFNGPNIYSNIYDIIYELTKKGKKVVNYFFISLDSDYLNAYHASKLSLSLDNILNSHNYYFTRISEALDFTTNNNVIKFGSNEILSYDYVVRDNIYKAAKKENLIYKDNTKLNPRIEWANLSRIKQQSNLYSIASIPFKLSLLGFDKFDIKKEEFIKRYNPNNEEYSIEKYIEMLKGSNEFASKDVLAYLEHERWNAFELALGVLPYKMKNESDYITKSDNELYHPCLTTPWGLVVLYEKTGTDFIVYDYDIMDNFINHSEESNLKKYKL